jgi:hypothetical protein
MIMLVRKDLNHLLGTNQEAWDVINYYHAFLRIALKAQLPLPPCVSANACACIRKAVEMENSTSRPSPPLLI